MLQNDLQCSKSKIILKFKIFMSRFYRGGTFECLYDFRIATTILAEDKNLLLGLPIPGRSADRGQMKCNSTTARCKTLHLDYNPI